jgi:hypothetical protein
MSRLRSTLRLLVAAAAVATSMSATLMSAPVNAHEEGPVVPAPLSNSSGQVEADVGRLIVSTTSFTPTEMLEVRVDLESSGSPRILELAPGVFRVDVPAGVDADVFAHRLEALDTVSSVRADGSAPQPAVDSGTRPAPESPSMIPVVASALGAGALGAAVALVAVRRRSVNGK